MAAPTALVAQVVPDSIEFLGLRPGRLRAEIEERLHLLGGGWRCTRSSDPRIMECRGTLLDSANRTLTLTGSLVDGALAVFVVRGAIGDSGLRTWHDVLAQRYGSTTPSRDHGQQSWQWIRGRQMLRLTTRRETIGRVVSVTMVDGPLLDSLTPP